MRARTPQVREFPARYRTGEVIGEGAMSVVLKTYDTHTREYVALKTLLPQPKPQHIKTLRLEIELTKRLSHPHVLPVLDEGVLRSGKPYYTMPLLTGHSLDRLISRGTITLYSAISTLQNICQVLEHAHTNGQVHCDLKPGNILLSERGDAYLIDWGTAASFQFLKKAPTKKSGGNTVFGTPLYIAPEVLRGQDPSPAADRYALGVILYRLLSGTYPFHDKDLKRLFRRACHEQPTLPQHHVSHDVPEPLQTLCMKLLSKQPEQRGSSCLGIAQTLEAWKASLPRRLPHTPEHSFEGFQAHDLKQPLPT